MELLIPVIVIVGVIFLPILWLIVNYNRFAALRQHMREAWADIDVELKRRHDLIPNLVETARGYMSHERETLERIVELRNRAATAHQSVAALAADETSLMREVRRLFAVVEDYPDLKADRHFLALQGELANTEDRIAAARRFYNGNVREMNTLREQFPTSIIASTFGFRSAEYFELASDAERIVPRVGFR